MKDKRKAVRIDKRLEVKFNAATENTAITSNLSENGMFIATCKGIEPGSTIDIKLQLPDSTPLFISGKVIRSPRTETAQKGMGVELDSPPSDYITYVQKLLNGSLLKSG